MNERVSKCNISRDLSGKLSFFSREMVSHGEVV